MVRSGKSPALAAWIGRRKYGAKGMAAMSHHGTAGAPVAEKYAAAHKAVRTRYGK